MADQMENAVIEKGPVYTRKTASLPASFSSITVNNIVGKLVIVEQLDPNTRCTDRGPFQVAKSIKLMEDKNGVVQEVLYDLEELTLDQLRKLCHQLNCAGYALAPKIKCRRLLAVHTNSVELYNQDWNTDSANAVSKKLNFDLRKVNAFFHKEVYENI
jgi:hypothetical protein